ncbi:10867_t:CDS:1, partial [Gigaspora rosea]
SKGTPLTSIDEIFMIQNLQAKEYSAAVLWLHTNAIYEIWCLYTAQRWGEGTEYKITGLAGIRAKMAA